MSYILAHDLGTTGNKVTLFDEQARPVATAFEGYETSYPRPNWAEQDPGDWWRAVRASTRAILASGEIAPGEIAAVGFSGMMMGALPVDRAGEPLAPAIIWADQRATAEAANMAAVCGTEEIYRRTGHRPGASYTAAKIAWVRDHHPEIYHQAQQFLQAKDYAAYRLSGVFATDYSDASGTNLFDLDRRDWANDIAAAVGLDPDKMPPARPSNTVIGKVTAAAAQQTGLVQGTPVVIGGGDGACATVGAGSVRPGDAYNYIGSSSWIAVTADKPLYDPQMRTFTFVHLDPELFFPIGTMQSAGGSYDWLERLLRGENEARIYDELETAASHVEPGAQGLLFLPYLIGERSPHWNPNARGVFAGLSMTHGRAEMARAVMEGVAFNLKMILDIMLEQDMHMESMRLIGGGARSALWRQILADVYRLPLRLPTLLTEATSLGAAIAAGVAVGMYKDFGAAAAYIQTVDGESPGETAAIRYEHLYAVFQEAYRALVPSFDQLARFVDSSLSDDRGNISSGSS